MEKISFTNCLRLLTAVAVALSFGSLVSVVSQVSAAPPAGSTLTDVAAYWSFDSPTNFNVPDVGGSTLTKGNGASYSANGKFGGALSVNGSTQSLYDLSSPAYLPIGNSPYSQSLWFKPTAVNSAGFISWGLRETKRFNALRMLNVGAGIHHYWYRGDITCEASACPFSTSTWSHVATTYDGTTRSIYFNGVLKISDTPGALNTTAVNFHIGSTASNEFFNGLIDDVAIYKRALTAAEVTALANTSLPSNSTAPTVSGTARTGSRLTASDPPGSWNGSPSSYEYQWKRASVDGSYSDISSATLSSYLLTDDDIGKYIKVSVVARNSVGASSAVLSAASSVVVDLEDSVVPAATIPVATATGFTFTISNYLDSYTYASSTSKGSVSRSGDDVLVTGLSAGESATVTIAVTRANYKPASKTVTGSASPAATTTTTSSTTTVAPVVVIEIQAPVTTVAQGQASLATIAPTTTVVGRIAPTTPTTTTPKLVSRSNSPAPTTTVGVTTTTITPPKVAAVAAGETAVQVDGVETKSQVSRENNQLVVSAGALKATIGGLNKNGTAMSLDEDGNVRLRSGDVVRIKLAGFRPNSTVEAWLFSTPVLLGSSVVSADGSVLGDFTIPKNSSEGSHRIVIVAKSKYGKATTFTVGVEVGEIARTSTITRVLISIPIALAVLFGLFLPAVSRRRRKAVAA
jgi:hypothetical protein